MKRASLALLVFLAVASFGGSFNCHSGDVDVHSDPDHPSQPTK